MEESNLFSLIQLLPKTDIHAHLNGSIRQSTLMEFINNEDKNKLVMLYQSQMNYETAFAIFEIGRRVITDLDIVRRITSEMIEDWNLVNCVYLEIRTTLKCIAGKSKEDYLRVVLEEIFNGNLKYTIQTRLIISLNRELDIDDYLETYELIKNFDDIKLKPLIVGIDYCGNESNEKHLFKDVIPIFLQFRELGLKTTIHIAENKDYQQFDFNKFLPDRISHTFFYSEIECLEVMKKRIPIEICPSSCFHVKNLDSFQDINFKNYFNKEIISLNKERCVYDLISINTDDTMLFNSNLNEEYYKVAVNFNLNINDLKNIVIKTIESIFETNEEFRMGLRNKINNFYV